MGITKHLYAHCRECGYYEEVAPAEVEIAKAALDELLSEQEEWVEVATPTGAIYRFTPEGECKQSRYKDGADWHKEYWPAADCIAKAFLRVRDEAVRELVRAVLVGLPITYVSDAAITRAREAAKRVTL